MRKINEFEGEQVVNKNPVEPSDSDSDEEKNNDLIEFDEGTNPDDLNQSLPVDESNESLIDAEIEPEGLESSEIREAEVPSPSTVPNIGVVPKEGVHIHFRDEGTLDPWQEGIVINRAGKAKGKHKM